MTRLRPRLQLLQERLDQAYPDARCALDHQDPFQLVVATILSAQCTDARVNLTTPALFARFPDPQSLAEASVTELEALIRPTGFYHNKAKNLIGMAQALVARHGGQVPDHAEALSALPGVGQKTANVVLANAFGIPALAVDTHIFRVARRLGLSAAGTPEKVEADLTQAFPRERWIPLHHQFIWHGRRVCHARKPACSGCTLRDQCPTGSGAQADPHTGLPVVAGSAPALSYGNVTGGGPQRVVSLVPSLTELLVQWGLASRLVGRTRYCVEPAWIRATVPAVGGTKDPDLAVICALAPDLVLLETDENTRETAEALAQAGIPMLALTIRTLKDVAQAWEILGQRFGVEAQARERQQALQARLKPRRKATGLPRTVMLVWREPFVSAGPDTYLGDLMRHRGFQPLGEPGYGRLDAKALVDLDPEVVLLPTDPYPWPQRAVQAVRALLPRAVVHRLEGRALTWFLSRTEVGLDLLATLR